MAEPYAPLLGSRSHLFWSKFEYTRLLKLWDDFIPPFSWRELGRSFFVMTGYSPEYIREAMPKRLIFFERQVGLNSDGGVATYFPRF